jgi:hypothetical protein
MNLARSRTVLRNLSVCSIACFLLSLCGCQTWSNGAYPLQNVSRVPPPGTGSYQMPNGYYNNGTAALSPTGQVTAASANVSGLRPASGGLPTTTLNDFGTSQNQVQTAQFTQPANAGQSGVSGPTDFSPTSNVQNSGFQSQAISSGASASFSDSQPDTSELQWQQ